MEKDINSPVKTAIMMEIDGMDFYKTAAENSKNAFGKKMFLSFIEDEKNHLKALEMIFKGIDFDKIEKIFKNSNPQKRIETVFSKAKQKMSKEEQKGDADDIKALEIAMKMEKEGYEYYMDIAENAEEKEVRALFKILAGEEIQHYTILQDTHTYLTDTGNWFIWEEKAIIDGGG